MRNAQINEKTGNTRQMRCVPCFDVPVNQLNALKQDSDQLNALKQDSDQMYDKSSHPGDCTLP